MTGNAFDAPRFHVVVMAENHRVGIRRLKGDVSSSDSEGRGSDCRHSNNGENGFVHAISVNDGIDCSFSGPLRQTPSARYGIFRKNRLY